MENKLARDLFTRYPELFMKRSYRWPRLSLLWSKLTNSWTLPPITESLMRFSFECGSGWHKILDDLFKKMVAVNKEPRLIVSQVKEKFGTLRVYCNCSSDIIEDLIEVAERRSGQTCEVCGAYGELTGKGWLTTLCKECLKKRKKS